MCIKKWLPLKSGNKNLILLMSRQNEKSNTTAALLPRAYSMVDVSVLLFVVVIAREGNND